MSDRELDDTVEPPAPERAADVAATEGRGDDRNEALDQSPVPDPEAGKAGAADDPQAD